jgi:hypothetical protein
LGPASGSRSLKSCVSTQSSRVICQDSMFLGFGFLNIIIYIINIIIFVIIKSIRIKNIIIYVINIIIFIIIKTINIKNSIICVINIIFLL